MTEMRSEKPYTAKPILFNTNMVRAILAGTKTVTRRLIKPRPPESARLALIGDKRHAMDLSIDIPGPDDHRIYTPPYLPDDILYVRETWYKDPFRFMYRANYLDEERFYRNGKEITLKWRPSIHMPKEAARIFLRVTDLRVERLQEITDEGAEHEGICGYYVGMGESAYSRYSNWNEAKNHLYDFPRGAFADLWTHTLKPTDIGKYGWAANPWVWVISFKRCEKPEGWPWSE